MNSRVKRRIYQRAMGLVMLMAVVVATSSLPRADTGTCGGASTTLPFTDVPPANVFFCSIAEAFFSGLTNGTGPGAYSPAVNVTREQMAAFVTRTMDQSVKRGSSRTILDQNWTIQGANNLALTTVGDGPQLIKSDGSSIWVANRTSGTVSQVRASDGKLLDTWTGATGAFAVLCALGKVYVASLSIPSSLYEIDPTQPAGPVTVLSSNLGTFHLGIAFDGQRIWTANEGGPSVSIITLNPVTVTNVSPGFTFPQGIIYDGVNIWVSDDIAGSVDKLHKLDSSGNILLSVDVGAKPRLPAFDGANIWVPNESSNTVSVMRASTGIVLATLGGNGLDSPVQAAFDGERIIVTSQNGDSVSLWNASDFTPIGSFSTGANTFPYGACSDGLYFWIALNNTDKLARF
jgi:DNA-binding beta-propeller fold protein YncE